MSCLGWLQDKQTSAPTHLVLKAYREGSIGFSHVETIWTGYNTLFSGLFLEELALWKGQVEHKS